MDSAVSVVVGMDTVMADFSKHEGWIDYAPGVCKPMESVKAIETTAIYQNQADASENEPTAGRR